MNRLIRYSFALMVILLGPTAFGENAGQPTLLTEVPEAVLERNKLSAEEQKKLDTEAERAMTEFEAAATTASKTASKKKPD